MKWITAPSGQDEKYEKNDRSPRRRRVIFHRDWTADYELLMIFPPLPISWRMFEGARSFGARQRYRRARLEIRLSAEKYFVFSRPKGGGHITYSSPQPRPDDSFNSVTRARDIPQNWRLCRLLLISNSKRRSWNFQTPHDVQ